MSPDRGPLGSPSSNEQRRAIRELIPQRAPHRVHPRHEAIENFGRDALHAPSEPHSIPIARAGDRANPMGWDGPVGGMVPSVTTPILVTGANGRLGQSLALALAGRRPIRAAVRSERAAETLRALPETARPELVRVDWSDPDALARAGEGCPDWIHLVGILKETRNSRYESAHEGPARALALAAEKAGARRIVSMSILGASVDSSNACLSSKGRADAILLDGAVPATVLRVPMVLGPGELAAAALRARATAPVSFLVNGGRSLEQPIDSRDLVRALEGSLGADVERRALDLAGPESLPHRELVARVAALLGGRPRFVSLPLGAIMALAWGFERWLANPPVTRAMLGVLEHDDRIDPAPAAEQLGLELTPLDDTLRFTFRQESA
jgi:NADH dehydrogenase